MNHVSLQGSVRRQLVEAAIRAPSGDNSQPWSFLFRDDEIFIRVVASRAKSFFDYRYCGSYLSVGAVIENIRLQAAGEDLQVQVAYRHPTDADDVVAALRFQHGGPGGIPSERMRAMHTRTVNRRPFIPWPLAQETLSRVLSEPVEGPHVHVINRRAEIARWARVVELADRIRYSHPVIHEELYAKILFTKESAERVRIGLECDRLGMGPLAGPILRFLRPWSRVQRLSRWGLTRMLAQQSRMLALATGAMILVTIPEGTAEGWMRAGEQVQRLWVRAHENGLAVHPMTVAFYLDQRARTEGMASFLPDHHGLLQDLRRQLSQLMPGQVGAMLFRLGRTWPMSSTAIRLPVERFLRAGDV